ncbi:hypothetical protein J0S82_008605, partial [Galemys pyrenaicus]
TSLSRHDLWKFKKFIMLFRKHFENEDHYQQSYCLTFQKVSTSPQRRHSYSEEPRESLGRDCSHISVELSFPEKKRRGFGLTEETLSLSLIMYRTLSRVLTVGFYYKVWSVYAHCPIKILFHLNKLQLIKSKGTRKYLDSISVSEKGTV